MVTSVIQNSSGVRQVSYGKPWDAEEFEWDEGNESELAGHHVTPSEVEQIWRQGPTFVPNKRKGSAQWKMLGTTHGGRRLSIFLNYDARLRRIRVVTGFDAPPGDVTKYF